MATRTDNRRAETTARELELLRILGQTRRRRKQLPRQAEPRGIARDYGAQLLALLRRSWAGLSAMRAELPELTAGARAERERFDAGEGRRLLELIEQANAVSRAVLNPTAINRLAGQFALQTSSFQRMQLRRQTRAALGADVLIPDTGLDDIFEVWAAENAALIRSVGQDTVDEVARLASRAVASAQPHAELAADIAERTGFAEKRARRIARDQVAKLTARVNVERQRNLGVTHFIWRSVLDERTRDRHRSLDGKRFSFRDGAPGEGLPGDPVLCRCFAEPDFSGILGG